MAGPRFVRHVGVAAPFLQSHVELEVIAPLVPDMHLHGHGPHPPAPRPHQHSITPGTYDETARHCFEGLRYRHDGTENTDFVLNQSPYRNASILIAGDNFGLGSLQAFAVLRLMECGMRAVIAPSFGPVFFEDCFVYGLLPVTLDRQRISAFVRAIAVDPSEATTIDLEQQVIEHPRMTAMRFALNPRLRQNLLWGVDDLEEVLKHGAEAERFEEENRRKRPWIYR